MKIDKNLYLHHFKDVLNDTLLKPAGFSRSGEKFQRIEKSILIYDEAFFREMNDGLVDVVTCMCYKDRGEFFMQVGYIVFVPEVASENLKDDVQFNPNECLNLPGVAIDTRSVSGKKMRTYNLSKEPEKSIKEVSTALSKIVLPEFGRLTSREKLVKYLEKHKNQEYTLCKLYYVTGQLEKASKILNKELKGYVKKFGTGALWARNSVPHIIFEMQKMGIKPDIGLLKKYKKYCEKSFKDASYTVKELQKRLPDVYNVYLFAEKEIKESKNLKAGQKK